jgi:hypothetical protein
LVIPGVLIATRLSPPWGDVQMPFAVILWGAYLVLFFSSSSWPWRIVG